MSEEYCIGIDYGTSNSCVGVYINGVVEIVPNRIGERITPSIVYFTNDNKVLVGDETICQNMQDYKHIIYEVKRFIGLNYDEFTNLGYDKNLNYDIENIDNIPKIKIETQGGVSYYSAEDISAFIIKRMVECAENFIEDKIEGIKIKKALITVPAHFSEKQRDALINAAKTAGIEIPRIINEPTAASLSYGIEKDIINNEKKKIIKHNLETEGSAAPIAIKKEKSGEKIIVFDFGGGTLDITILEIKKILGETKFDIIATDGDTHLGGSDFDNLLIEYCINEFTKIHRGEIKKEQLNYKRLKNKCETAKKLLSITRETIINIDNFYEKEDLWIKITRDEFDKICGSLYQRIEDFFKNILEDLSFSKEDINKVLLIGGATKIIGVKNLIKRIFGEKKIKDDINPDEAVAIGATLQHVKITKKGNINYTLQDIIAFHIGINIKNPNSNDRNDELMYPLLKKFSRIPSFSDEKEFAINLTEKNPEIKLKIFEGKDKFIRNNNLLGEVIFGGINKLGLIEYKLKLSIDIQSKIKVTLKIDSLGYKEEKYIDKQFTHALKDVKKKKIKICKTQRLKSLTSVIESIKISKKKLSESSDNQIKYENLLECSQNYEDLIENYNEFKIGNELIFEKIFVYSKELINYYIERLKYKIEKENKEIINKITKYMKNLISQIGYLGEILNEISKIKEEKGLKNEFYEIFVNYMELMEEEKNNIKTIAKNKRYYIKLICETVYFQNKKYITKNDIEIMKPDIYKRYDMILKKNIETLKIINSFAFFIEDRVKEGKYIFGQNTGFTKIGVKLKKFDEGNLTITEIEEVLDIFKTMADSFDKKLNSIEEAFCLSNIIYINYKFFKKNYETLWESINRIKTILFNLEDFKYDWIKNIKQIIHQIEEENKNNLLFNI